MPPADRLSPGAVKLLQERHLAVLSTVMPDGSPQAAPVWVDVEAEGSHVLINTVTGSLKQRNIARDPRVAVTVVDGQNAFRNVVIRGVVVEMWGPDQGSVEHIHKLAQKYTGRERYEFRRDGETRVILRIRPTHVFERGTDR